MIVSTANIAPMAAISINPDTSLQDISVVTDGDYSSVFTDALDGSVTINFTFGQPVDIGYLAIGGSNISRKDSIKIEAVTTQAFNFWQTVDNEQLVSSDAFDLTVGVEDAIDDSALGADESKTIMYKVDLFQVQQIAITVMGGGTLSIAEIAMGEYYTIPKGEQAGYARAWSVPNIKTRSSANLNEAPINLSYEARSLTVSLKVPNNIMVDFDGWYKFIRFASLNTFYVLEDMDKFHSYAGFNAMPDMTKAHTSTRKLGVSAITFSAHAKSTEALYGI